jgi:hypothetical protein
MKTDSDSLRIPSGDLENEIQIRSPVFSQTLPVIVGPQLSDKAISLSQPVFAKTAYWSEYCFVAIPMYRGTDGCRKLERILRVPR